MFDSERVKNDLTDGKQSNEGNHHYESQSPLPI